MPDIDNIIDEHIINSVNGSIDEITSKCLKILKLDNVEFDKIQNQIIDIIKKKEDILYSESTGRYQCKNQSLIHHKLQLCLEQSSLCGLGYCFLL